MPSFRIRAATAKDVGILVEHRKMMFTEMSHPTKRDLEILDESYRAWALEMMGRGLFHGYIVTTARGTPAASGCVWLREEQPRPGRPASLSPYVLSVFTRPEYRRNGLASMIMMEAMEWAKKEGYPRILLHASKTGRKVYRKLGWERTWEMEYRSEEPEVRRRPSTKPRASRPPRPRLRAR